MNVALIGLAFFAMLALMLVGMPIAVSMAAVGIIAGVLSLGPRTVVFRAAYRTVPFFDLGRVSARWRDLVVLTAAILAAYAVNALEKRASAKSTPHGGLRRESAYLWEAP